MRLHAVFRAAKLRYSGVEGPGPGFAIKSCTCCEFIEISMRLIPVVPVLNDWTFAANASPPTYVPFDAARTSLLPGVFE